jgi:hypothetical protein
MGSLGGEGATVSSSKAKMAATPFRWSFEEIRSQSFLGRGVERIADDSWRLRVEFHLKRIA